MTLEDYLKYHPKIREELLNHKIIFDLKLAAARANYHLKVYTVQVDFEGFDLLIEGEDVVKKVQLKSTLSATTGNWEIHNSMLYPNIYVYHDFEFSEPLGCSFNDSGVVLIDVMVVDGKNISIEYYYCDIYILRCLELAIFQINAHSRNTAQKKNVRITKAD
jgi:hypothetical protein